jgi:DnaJ-class molecular chaperone
MSKRGNPFERRKKRELIEETERTLSPHRPCKECKGSGIIVKYRYSCKGCDGVGWFDKTTGHPVGKERVLTGISALDEFVSHGIKPGDLVFSIVKNRTYAGTPLHFPKLFPF